MSGTPPQPTDAAVMRDAVVRAAFALLPPEQIAIVVANRAIIEQAKGMLMMIYAVDADQAFDLLTWRSKQSHVGLAALAHHLTHAFPALLADVARPTRADYDRVLLDPASAPPDRQPNRERT